ncbi:Probable cobalt transporter subunit (CbtA) [Jatrophihabitans endophyticus]|uniref:Probable cobalt transporter subunit (CbtA) n=1 Tax=Jatrophihabitans endophyticus TaxID=1206085 RepID=A0A1M5Q6P6_9ACTN|nr:CbtA family protein [Jatrophihabitans endophyticus]SHH09725.1 Probable cobalt transporter subunit (CbtA) [Jatrophihabitans endophyticus]
MESRIIVRGMLAGLVGGVLAFVFARIFAEPKIQAAIDYESDRDAAQHALDRANGIHVEEHEHELFSRAVQGNLGIGVGIVVFGIAMGALFAVAYSICLGRVGRLQPRAIALLVAAGGFLGLYLVPFVKYPANPPAIGHEETIKARGALYLVTVACSVAFLIAAVWLGQRLAERFGNWTAALLAGAAFVVAIGVVMIVLPSTGELAANRDAGYGNVGSETPLPLRNAAGDIVFPGFPADVLFTFRLYSVGAQLLMWTAIGLVFAPLADRLLGRGTPRPTVRRSDPVPS